MNRYSATFIEVFETSIDGSFQIVKEQKEDLSEPFAFTWSRERVGEQGL
jgi:hypothetical protein